jgi:hypothetical protein
MTSYPYDAPALIGDHRHPIALRPGHLSIDENVLHLFSAGSP